MYKTVDSLRVLRYKKAPYKAKIELIRAKQLPKALYGCETAPVNEGALNKLQAAIVDTITFTTGRRSSDLTLSVATNGVEVDPDVIIFKNRVLGMRRAKALGKENEELIENIMEIYSRNKEPGIMEYSEDQIEKLKEKEDGGEPMSRQQNHIAKPV